MSLHVVGSNSSLISLRSRLPDRAEGDVTDDTQSFASWRPRLCYNCVRDGACLRACWLDASLILTLITLTKCFLSGAARQAAFKS